MAAPTETVIPGSNGTWQVYVFDRNDPPEIKWKFHTDPSKKTCRKICLIQVVHVHAFETVGGVEKELPGPCDDWWNPPSPYGYTKPDRVTDKDNHEAWVDHRACESDPFIDGDDKPHDAGAQGASDGTGSEPADGTDKPTVEWSTVAARVTRFLFVFEVSAICVDTGEILGTITWEWEQSRGGNPKIKLDGNGRETIPTPEFDEAVKKFAKNHSKDKDGETYWFCPEAGKNDASGQVIRGPDGQTADPYGKAIPGAFKRKWLASPTELKFTREGLGGGPRFETLAEVLTAAQKRPEEAILKFSWHGNQMKASPAIAFHALRSIHASILAPHIDDTRYFGNDLTAGVVAYSCTPGFIGHALTRLPAGRPVQGSVMLTVIANSASASAASYSTPISGMAAISAAHEMAAHADTTSEILGALSYIALNMGA